MFCFLHSLINTCYFLSYFSHLSGDKMASYCGFDIHFPAEHLFMFQLAIRVSALEKWLYRFFPHDISQGSPEKQLIRVYIKRFITSSCLMQLWRLRRPTVTLCWSWRLRKASDVVQSKSKGLRSRGPDGVRYSAGPGRPVCQLPQSCSKAEFSPSAFCSVQAHSGLDDAHPHWGGHSAFNTNSKC